MSLARAHWLLHFVMPNRQSYSGLMVCKLPGALQQQPGAHACMRHGSLQLPACLPSASEQLFWLPYASLQSLRGGCAIAGRKGRAPC